MSQSVCLHLRRSRGSMTISSRPKQQLRSQSHAETPHFSRCLSNYIPAGNFAIVHIYFVYTCKYVSYLFYKLLCGNFYLHTHCDFNSVKELLNFSPRGSAQSTIGVFSLVVYDCRLRFGFKLRKDLTRK